MFFVYFLVYMYYKIRACHLQDIMAICIEEPPHMGRATEDYNIQCKNITKR